VRIIFHMILHMYNKQYSEQYSTVLYRGEVEALVEWAKRQPTLVGVEMLPYHIGGARGEYGEGDLSLQTV